MSWTLVGNIKGPQGATGNTGSTGAGVPAGGAAGQLLAKLSNSDFDDHWVDPPSGAAWGGITGTLSSQTDLQAALNAKASTAQAVPAGGTTGQQLVKNSNTDFDTKWSAPSAVVAGSDTQIQYNSGGSLAGSAGLTFDATSKALTVGGATVTANAPVANFSQTWNAGAVTFTGFKLNVTDTASAAASLLADLQLGGSSKLKVDKAGNVTAGGVFSAGAAGNTSALAFGYGAAGFYFSGPGGNIRVQAGGSYQGSLGTNGASFASSTLIGFESGAAGSSPDTNLWRDASGVLALKNVGNQQIFRVYNTTDGTNLERGKFGWNANVLEIGAESAGTGSLRGVKFLGASFSFAAPPTMPSFTVGTLPSASTSGAGAHAYATDLSSLTNGSTATGGGSSKGTVVSNGTNWIVLG